MKKIVINRCYGGFGLSPKAIAAYAERKGLDAYSIVDRLEDRDDAQLIQIVEEMGQDAAGANAWLKIVSIPDDVEWIIQEYDGMEWIAEKHKSWL